MMRLPYFAFHAPRSVGEAADLLATHGPDAMLVAGGTDLLPNMKRRQHAAHVISLRRVAELRQRHGATLGAGLTLTEISAIRALVPTTARSLRAASRHRHAASAQHGMLGGNLCLDTRCNYYDQITVAEGDRLLYEEGWRASWVATSAPNSAVSSTDTAPALLSSARRSA
jgi:4-hydroxybenzoyl-CoA reductase subunit beta